MKIKVIGSSSEGNCYLLQDAEGSTLILECGVKMQDIKKALGFSLAGVVGCIVTHEHKDHALAVKDMLKAGIKVYALPSVFARLRNKALAVELQPKQLHHIGNYDIRTLEANHDVPCLAYIIDNKEMGRMIFATDTFAFGYKVPNCSVMMLECNYADDILEENIEKHPDLLPMRKRLLTTHMELQTTKQVVKRYARDLDSVILIHLSDGNSDAVRFKREIESASGVPTHVASAGDEIILY
jgi:phosphoribosyl 1,2-cyclic phosphodiesterase